MLHMPGAGGGGPTLECAPHCSAPQSTMLPINILAARAVDRELVYIYIYIYIYSKIIYILYICFYIFCFFLRWTDLGFGTHGISNFKKYAKHMLRGIGVRSRYSRPTDSKSGVLRNPHKGWRY